MTNPTTKANIKHLECISAENESSCGAKVAGGAGPHDVQGTVWREEGGKDPVFRPVGMAEALAARGNAAKEGSDTERARPAKAVAGLALLPSKTAHVVTAVLDGVQGLAVLVEADLASSLPSFAIVGLGDAAVREARERVRAAVRNAGFTLPPRRITVNLAPADRRKEGAGLDLPIALAVLTAAELVEGDRLVGTVVLGELALDGGVRPCPGVLPRLVAAKDSGALRALVPLGNLAEASLVDGLEVYGVEGLNQAAAWCRGELDGARPSSLAEGKQRSEVFLDLSVVRGQESARHALLVAAAGGHALLMSGPPGAGKTLLARALPGILPPLEPEEALEVLTIRSASGLLGEVNSLPTQRPLRAPHHTCSVPALVGGGRPLRPGEVSLAHRGVLFLDELPEFPRAGLEALREPLEDGVVRIRRVHGAWELPARFQLLATMNPCPCGRAGSGNCSCALGQIRAYRSRVSGPLRDRFDLVVRLDPVPYTVLASDPSLEDSAAARAKVQRARELQAKRLAHLPASLRTNSCLSPDDLRRYAWPNAAGRKLLGRAVDTGLLTARGHDRILRVARTLADLEQSKELSEDHILDALSLRQAERELDG